MKVLFIKKKKIIEIKKKYFRPAEVHFLRGNYFKAKKILKWKPKTSISKFTDIMINYEINNFKN